MAGPKELSFDAVRDFILKNGGKVRNHDLVKHFKKFLTRPENRDDARNYFKEIVNQVAIIRTEDNEKYLILKKKFRPPDYSGDSLSSCSSPSPSLSSSRVLEPQYPTPPRQPPPYRAPPPPLASPVHKPTSFPEPFHPVSAPTTPLVESDQNIPPVPPRRKSFPEKENQHIPTVRSMDGNAEVDGESEKKISVKERMQKFNRMASESDLLKVPTTGSSKKKVDKEDDDSSSVTSLDPKTREWVVSAARNDYQTLAKLAAECPRLVRTKDPATGWPNEKVEIIPRPTLILSFPPPPPPISFEIPIHEDGDSIIKRHPPKRFRRLEENQMDSRDLTHEWIENKQMEAEARRNELLMLRMQSANSRKNRHNRRLVHSNAFNHSMDDIDAEEN